MKGQLAILSSNALDRVCALLADPMPNVVAAAAECLCKVASLVMGAQALVSRSVMSSLAELVSGTSDNLTVKEWAAATLLQIYRSVPSAPRVDTHALAGMLSSPDPRLHEVLVALLDLCEYSIPAVQVSAPIVAHVQALQATDADSRAQATADLLADVQDHPHLVLQLVCCTG